MAYYYILKIAPVFIEFTPAQKWLFFAILKMCPNVTIAKLPKFLTNLPLHKNTKMTIFLPLSNLPHFYTCKTMPKLIAWQIQKQTDWQNTHTYKKTNKQTKTSTTLTYRTDWQTRKIFFLFYVAFLLQF